MNVESTSYRARRPVESMPETVFLKAAKPARTGGHLTLMFMLLGLFFLAGLSPCLAGDVVLIEGKRLHPFEDEAIRRLVDFYGLTLYTVDVGSQDAVNRAMSRMRSSDTLAVLGFAEA